jgi:hypothetical protein
VTPNSDQDEKDLVSLLGQNMPNGSSTGSSNDNLSDFMSLRLLLLRAPGKRSAQENELIEILKSSFKSYAKDRKRHSKDLANLIVRDWVCLKSTYGLVSPASSVQSPPGPLAQPLSHPVARRLSSMEPPQRRPSAGSLKPAFQSINQSLNLQTMQQNQFYQHMSNTSTVTMKPQFQSIVGSNQTQLSRFAAPQMTHVNYLPRSLVNPQTQLSNSAVAMPSPSSNTSVSSNVSVGSSTNGGSISLNHLARGSNFQHHQPMQTPSSDVVTQQ